MLHLHRWMIPNLLTLLRLPCCAVLVLFFLGGEFLAALVVYLFIEALDQADGKLARAFGWETLTGRFLDPFVDSFVHLTSFACLLSVGAVPLWIFLVVLFRETGLSFLRLLASFHGVRPGGSWPGKGKAVIHAVTISVCLLGLSGRSPFPPALSDVLVYLAAFASLASGMYYLNKYRRVLEKSFLVQEAV